MLAAIGIILISKQIPLALGYDKPDFWTSGFLELFTSKNLTGNITEFSHHITLTAIIITVVSLLIMILMQQPFAKKLKVIPAPLLVVIFGIEINLLTTAVSPDIALKPTQLVNIPSNIFASITFPDF